jgi:single-stranded-DNA-specific exonuclease
VAGFDEDGIGRGSCRSVAGFDLLTGLKACGAHLARFGGHGTAAGVEVHRREFEPFREAFHEVCRRTLAGRNLDPALDLEGWVTLDQLLDPRFAQVLGMMEPFGEGNPEPVWGLRGARAIGAPRVVGERHLKMLVGTGTGRCEAIGFGMGDRDVPEGELDLAFQLRQNTYMGRTMPQLNLVDFRPSERARGDGAAGS